ncbi:myosin heavy chain, clone 203-like [Neltuma alba]|uniref:myosin heavy chain, clone 203-like n=1 Tax=Neltuma alba TaxID=207710 RepID=UPI0010A3295F|nr:myosin heavy chain, clone 203-like [Prosopis alba]XP_028770120.1 myosin heavy chain, clone 203-like [Prosopis alba]
MIRRRSGHIISTSSITGVLGGVGPHAYKASKHAMVGLMKNTTSELGEYEIQFSLVSFRRSFGRSIMMATTKVYVSEVDKLKAELKEKTESFENLKKSHDAQADEINEAKLLCEDLRNDLENKESIIKHISSANDKLRETYEERLKILEDEKRALILELEEAKEKACLSIPIKKCLESEKSLKAANEDEKFHKLIEEENRMKEEQVTWKKEQLENLEEAQVDKEKQEEKINNANEDPELETYALLDDISSLQIKLHSQTKTLEQLERELHMSKLALAREESTRKQLETQLSECKVQFNNSRDTSKEQENQELEASKGSLLESSIIDELKLENEELSVMLLVLQQAISEAQAMDNKGDHNNEESELEIYKEKLEEAYDALDQAIIELDELIYEGSELECEVGTWKSACERLKNDLEESHAKRKELEASLLSQVIFGESLEQERRVDEKQVKEAENERVKFLEIIEEKDKILKVLQKEIEWLEQEAFRREFESAVVVKSLTEKTNEHVKDKFLQLMNERKMRMDEIMQQMTSLEEHFCNSLTTFSSLHEDDEVPHSEAEAILQKLKNENNRLMEKAHRLSSEREHLLDYFLGLGDKICEFSTVDSELMDMVGKMAESFENKDGDDDDDDNESHASKKMIEHPATGVKNLEAIST